MGLYEKFQVTNRIRSLEPFAACSSAKPPEVSSKPALAASPKLSSTDASKRVAEIGTTDPPEEGERADAGQYREDGPDAFKM